MKKTESSNRLNMIFFLLIISVIYTLLITVPVNNNVRDIYVDVTITKPLVGDAAFTSLNVYAQPHTVLSAPALGSIISSGTVVVMVSAPSRSTQSNIGTIYRSFSTNSRIVLKSVPINENDVTVKLYEDNTLTQTEKVTLQ